MRIYLDDCSDEDKLVELLSLSGHSVLTPRSELTIGADDSLHLDYAAKHDCVLMTKNPADFVRLHEEYLRTNRHHSGIILVYQDALRRKNMQPAEIVSALENLISSGIPITNEIHNLNHWR